MAHFLVAHVKVKDSNWIPEYAAKVHHIAAKHGGKYLSRSGNIQTLEGPDSTADLIAIIQFPSNEAAHGFVSDPDYAPFAKARQEGTESHFVVIDDTDVAGTIPYLPSGG